MTEFEQGLIESLNRIAKSMDAIADSIECLAGAMPYIPTVDGKAITHHVECFHHEFPQEFYIHTEED